MSSKPKAFERDRRRFCLRSGRKSVGGRLPARDRSAALPRASGARQSTSAMRTVAPPVAKVSIGVVLLECCGVIRGPIKSNCLDHRGAAFHRCIGERRRFERVASVQAVSADDSIGAGVGRWFEPSIAHRRAASTNTARRALERGL